MRGKSAITLVALIITIIVLLILATVSISLVINNGILDHAQHGVGKYSEEEELEQVKLAVASAMLKGNGFLNTENLNSELQNKFGEDKEAIENPDGWSLVLDKNYTIDKNGNVEKHDKLLPDEYQQVEYLESSGTQYIDTKYYPKPNTKIEISIYRKTATTYSNPYGCGWYGTSEFTFEMYYNLQNGNCRWDRGSSENGTSPKLEENMKYIIIQDDKNCYVDDELVATIRDNSNKTSNSSLVLFARNSSGINPFYGRIYYSKIWDNENIVRDYIPCYSTTTVTNAEGVQVSANTKGMYDLVEGKFYTNKGTGTFGYGMEDGTYVAPQ